MVQRPPGWDETVLRARALAAEAGSLVKAGFQLDPSWLGPAAGWVAETAPAWEDIDGEAPAVRSYRLLVSSLHLEAWLICWPPGGRLSLHDHGGASGALRVVRGNLYEEFVPGGATRVRSRLVTAGEAVAFDGDYLHDVANRGSVLATSVHLYAAASRTMSFYRLHPSSRRPVPVTMPEPRPASDAGLRISLGDRTEAD